MSDTIKIALSGNPNVGKSTVFNALTGLKQHTGNWTGKTVDVALGEYKYKENTYTIIDVPGTYSLTPHSSAICLTFLFVSPDIILQVAPHFCNCKIAFFEVGFN